MLFKKKIFLNVMLTIIYFFSDPDRENFDKGNSDEKDFNEENFDKENRK